MHNPLAQNSQPGVLCLRLCLNACFLTRKISSTRESYRQILVRRATCFGRAVPKTGTDNDIR